MSTFCGKTKEYPFISIDRFDGGNLRNSIFLLSHNHTDHTVGLFKEEFLYRLQCSKDIKLYCSSVTRDLLLLEEFISTAVQKWPQLGRSIVALDLEEGHMLPVTDPHTGLVKENVTVTLLPAKHCPGSVMFLIEGNSGTILYTGDFRLSRCEFERMHALNCGNGVKDIKSVYIDTTFCSPEAMYIPPREESVQCAIKVIEEWITQSPHHVIHLSHAAGLGYEQLYREISNHFNMKVHVNRKKFAEYRKVGDMHSFTTPNPAVTQIHACKSTEHYTRKRSKHGLPCGYLPPHRGDELQVRTVKLSTMAFVQHVGTEKCVKMINDHFYRVCYSFHASYSEVRDALMFLKPGRAFPNVVPINSTEIKVQERLNHFLKLARKARSQHGSQEARPLGKLKIRKKRTRRESSQFSDDHCFDFMDDSPPKKPKNDTKSKSEILSKPTNPEADLKERHETGVRHTEVKAEVKDTEVKTTEVKATQVTDSEVKPTEAEDTEKVLCDATAFPTLFGNISSDESEKNESFTEMNESKDIEENDESNIRCLAAGSDDSDSGSDNDLLPEDEEMMKRFSPAAGGSFGDLVGYVSDEDDEDTDGDDEGGEEKEDNMKEGGLNNAERKPSEVGHRSRDNNMFPCSTQSWCSGQTSHCKTVKSKRRASSDTHHGLSHVLDDCQSSEGSQSILKPYQCQRLGETGDNSVSRKAIKRKSNDGLSADSDNDKDRSIEIVDISEAEDWSDGEGVAEPSGRKRRLSENVLQPFQRKPAGSKPKPLRTSLHDTGDGEELHRPSVVRYPTSGFYSSHCLDKHHAVRGYHNLMTNIEKILKSPTRNSLSDDADSGGVMLIPAPASSSSKDYPGPSGHRTGNAQGKHSDSLDYKHKKYRKYKTVPSACQSKPNDDSDTTADSSCDADKSANLDTSCEIDHADIKSESDCVNWLDNGQECIDLTADDDEEAVSNRSDAINDVDVISGSEEMSDDGSDVNELHPGELVDGEGYENGASECITDSDGDFRHRDVKFLKHRRRRKQHYELTSYSSDSDMDSAATYDSDEWFLEVNRVRKAMKQTDSKSHPVTGSDVIVLDDSSSCSAAARPESVSVSTQATELSKVSPLAHQSGESLVELPSPAPAAWSNDAGRGRESADTRRKRHVKKQCSGSAKEKVIEKHISEESRDGPASDERKRCELVDENDGVVRENDMDGKASECENNNKASRDALLTNPEPSLEGGKDSAPATVESKDHDNSRSDRVTEKNEESSPLEFSPEIELQNGVKR